MTTAEIQIHLNGDHDLFSKLAARFCDDLTAEQPTHVFTTPPVLVIRDGQRVSRLPYEVLERILDYLALLVGRSSKARRAEGYRIALVCKGWKQLGRRLAWEIVTLPVSAEEVRSLVRHVSRQKGDRLFTYVRTLKFEYPREGPMPRPVAPADIPNHLHLLTQCLCLTTLTLPPVNIDFLHRLSSVKTLTSRLEFLDVHLSLSGPFVPERLFAAVARFTHLKTFRCITFLVAEWAILQPRAPGLLPTRRCLKWANLVFDMLNPGHQTFLHAFLTHSLLTLTDPTTVRTLNIAHADLLVDKTWFLLREFVNLTHLSLKAHPESLPILLPLLTNSLFSHFTSLMHLTLDFSPSASATDPPPSPLPAPLPHSLFLLSLPPSLTSLTYRGFSFSPSSDKTDPGLAYDGMCRSLGGDEKRIVGVNYSTTMQEGHEEGTRREVGKVAEEMEGQDVMWKMRYLPHPLTPSFHPPWLSPCPLPCHLPPIQSDDPRITLHDVRRTPHGLLITLSAVFSERERLERMQRLLGEAMRAEMERAREAEGARA